MSGQLLPTPLAATGAPHAAAPGWLARAIEETPGRALRERLGDSPVTGGRRVIDGVAMVEVTFVAHEPAGREVLVHVNSLTDAIRTALDPTVMIPVGSSGAQTLSWWLPADGCYSYRYWRADQVPRDAGATREDWFQVHREGQRDPLNPAVLPSFDLREQSVWYGPDYRSMPWAPAGEAEERWRLGDGIFAVLPGDERTLVLFDGRRWRAAGVASALRAAGYGHTVVAVDTGEGEQRAAFLTTADGCAPLVERARELGGGSGEVIVAGQSFGGLACVELATHCPGLVSAVIAQSPSLWFAGDPIPDPEAEGTLLRGLASGSKTLRVPLVVQAGTEERGLIHGARGLASIAAQAGLLVATEEFRGGHDLAWWRHGLLSGLSVLGSATPDPGGLAPVLRGEPPGDLHQGCADQAGHDPEQER